MECLFSFSFFKDSLLDIESLVGIFSFSTLNMFSHCLLASTVSDEKSVVSLIEDPLYMLSHFSFAVFSILFVFVFKQFDYNLSQCESL